MFLWVFLVFTIINFKNIQSTVTVCSSKPCPDLSSYGIECHEFENNIECLKSVSKNETQLGYALPYQAIAADKFIPNLEIIGEVTKTENSSQWESQIVVLTNRDISNFTQLKGFSYYNWGFGNVKAPNFVVDKLERILYESQNCRAKTTLAEKQACELDGFFGSSCRQGSWAYPASQDLEMKRKYSNLCKSCDFPFVCKMIFSIENNLHKDKPGVAVTYLEAIRYLGSLLYLCPNGTTSRRPCAWYQQPYPLIYTQKGLKDEITPELEELFSICSNKSSERCEGIFGNTFSLPAQYLTILDEDKASSVVPVLENYKPTSEPLKWCTTSDLETEKCEWLKFFSAHLIYPIDCIQKPSKLACVEAIENYEADLVEITEYPIKDNLISIATSITGNKHADLSTFPSDCVDKFHLSILWQEELVTVAKKHNCPNGVYRIFCNETNCTYLTEIIMRANDPNKENAQNLIGSLERYFHEANETRPFDLFGKFNGVPDLMFKSNTKLKLFNYEYEQPLQLPDVKFVFNNTPNKTTSKSSLSIFQVIGLVFLCIALVALRYAMIIWCRRKTRIWWEQCTS